MTEHERTVTITITRKANHRTVEFVFGESDLESFTLVGNVDDANDKYKFEELADIMLGLHALDNLALQAWDQQEDHGAAAPASASNEFAVPHNTMSELHRFRLRYTTPN